MKVLITGANGFLGFYLCRLLLERDYEVIATSKGVCRLPFIGASGFIFESLDFTDPFAVHDVFQKYQPTVVVHAGAMGKPDECEQQQWKAYMTNVEGTLTMLFNAEEFKSFFIFISTDFIFDGSKEVYNEDDLPGPVNFYGKTKVEAEEAVAEYLHDWAIIRTVMVYGNPGTGRGNILTIIKERLENGQSYQVFNDQIRTPTYVEDLVGGILKIIETRATGIYHLSGTDVLTPWEMASQLADHLNLDKSLVIKITAADLVQPAKRPFRTIFNIDKAKQNLDFHPISFIEGLRKTFP